MGVGAFLSKKRGARFCLVLGDGTLCQISGAEFIRGVHDGRCRISKKNPRHLIPDQKFDVWVDPDSNVLKYRVKNPPVRDRYGIPSFLGLVLARIGRPTVAIGLILRYRFGNAAEVARTDDPEEMRILDELEQRSFGPSRLTAET